MTEEQFIAYMEAKAVQNPSIPHDPDNKKLAFYVINDPYDLDEFDNALRNFAAFPAMLLEQGGGQLDDNDSANYTDTIESQFMIIDKRNGAELPRLVRARCKEVLMAILVQMRKDCRARDIDPGKYVDFRINQAPYTPVGPMAKQYYGYVVTFRFICPFSF